MTDTRVNSPITGQATLLEALPLFCSFWYPSAPDRVTMAREAQRARRNLANFCDWYQKTYDRVPKIVEFTPEVIASYINWGRVALSPSAFMRVRQTLYVFGEWACGQGYLRFNPARLTRRRKKNQVFRQSV